MGLAGVYEDADGRESGPARIARFSQQPSRLFWIVPRNVERLIAWKTRWRHSGSGKLISTEHITDKTLPIDCQTECLPDLNLVQWLLRHVDSIEVNTRIRVRMGEIRVIASVKCDLVQWHIIGGWQPLSAKRPIRCIEILNRIKIDAG